MFRFGLGVVAVGLLVSMKGFGQAPRAVKPVFEWAEVPTTAPDRLGTSVLQWDPGEKTLTVIEYRQAKVFQTTRIQTDLPRWPIIDWIRHHRVIMVVQRSAEFPRQIWVTRLSMDQQPFFQWQIEHEHSVRWAMVNPLCRRLISLDDEGMLRLWHLGLDPYDAYPPQQQVAELLREDEYKKHKLSRYEPHWSPLGNFYVLPNLGGGLRLIEEQDGSVAAPFATKRGEPYYRYDKPYLRGVLFSRHEKRMAVWRHPEVGIPAPGGDLVIWDNWNLREPREVRLDPMFLGDFDFHRDERRLLVASRDKMVVWDTEENKWAGEWQAEHAEIVRCHPHRDWVVVYDINGGLTLYDIKTTKVVATFADAGGLGKRLEFSDDGRLLWLWHGREAPFSLKAWALPSGD